MANTAVEQLCEVAHPSISPVIKLIKDVMAGAVLLVAVMAAICGGIIFIPEILSLI